MKETPGVTTTAHGTATEFKIVVDIDAPSERVFEVMSDVERWPEWNSAVTSVRRMDDGPFAVGSKAQVRQPKLSPAVWQVTEIDRPGRFIWITRSPGVKVEAGHWVEAIGHGSRVTLTLRFSGLLGFMAARISRGLCQRYIAMEAEGLRKRCES
jgi:uncharacterized membrane protein